MAVVADEDDAQMSALWEREWISHHYRLSMETVRKTFDPSSVEVFERVMSGMSVEEAARAFGMTTEGVYKIRQRVRARMEELIAQQIREEDAVDA